MYIVSLSAVMTRVLTSNEPASNERGIEGCVVSSTRDRRYALVVSPFDEDLGVRRFLRRSCR